MANINDLLKSKKVGAGQPVAPSDDNPTDPSNAPKISSEETEEKFSKKMHDIRLMELEREAKAKAGDYNLNYVNLVGFPITDDAISSIPKDVALANKVVCFFNNETEVRVATTEPSEKVVEILNKVLKDTTHNGHGAIYFVSENSFQSALKGYDRIPEIKKVSYGVEITGQLLKDLFPKVSNFGRLNMLVNEEKNMTNVFAIIVAGAIEAGASDIHIESEEAQIIIKYRVDGVLQQVSTMQKDLWERLSSRLKTIAKLKINVTDVPQDGRITIYLGENDKLDLRVSTLPTAYGESVVMRLLTSKAASLTFDDLGLRGKSYEDLKTAIEKTTGMIITTGPTGSGKTTTIYAILNKLNDGESKIITLEDPIEYKIKGIAQSQIDHSRGFSFSTGLRALMRQDPDIIMVGEMRDLETVEIGIEAALTGHKVLSTIHTNGAAGAVPRFLSMGAKPFLLAPALNSVIGQRLVRRVHIDCKVEYQPEADLIAKAQAVIDDLPANCGYPKTDLKTVKWGRGQGCEICKHIGYKGRLGIYEIFPMNEDFEKIILSGKVSSYDMLAAAKNHGMITMLQDGVLKAIDGLTTLDEVFRVAE